ncbi:hypothetical protein CRUP_034706 [Coryphaenoides rupestris]|nr:hypothetical protein CRUP_034706 [Coryphaenoides rupestris]
MVDEETQSPRPAEQNLYKRLSAQLESSHAPGLSLTTKDGNGNPPPKDQGPAFTVSHYAGQVSYDLTGTLMRNRDSLPHNLLLTMKSSESVLLRQLFQAKLSQTGSLLPAAQGHAALRGPKAALLLRKGPPAAAPTSTPGGGGEELHHPEPRQPRRYQELTKILKRKGPGSFLQRLERCGPVTAAVQLRPQLTSCHLPLEGLRTVEGWLWLGGRRVHIVPGNRAKRSRASRTAEQNSVDSAAAADVMGTWVVVVVVVKVVVVLVVKVVVVVENVELVEGAPQNKELTSLADRGPQSLKDEWTKDCEEQGLKADDMAKRRKTKSTMDKLRELNDELLKKSTYMEPCITPTPSAWMSWRRRLKRKEDHSSMRAGRGAEDMGLHTYDQLVLQNASDIARESDRLRCYGNGPPLGERPEPVVVVMVVVVVEVVLVVVMVIMVVVVVEAELGVVEKAGKAHDGGGGGGRLIRHFRSSSVPTPLAMENMVRSAGIMPVKKWRTTTPPPRPSTATTDDGAAGGGGAGLASPRKQPPPKPKRDPNTRLSASYEVVSAGLATLVPREIPTTPEAVLSPAGGPGGAGSPPKTQLSPTDPAGNGGGFPRGSALSAPAPTAAERCSEVGLGESEPVAAATEEVRVSDRKPLSGGKGKWEGGR